MLRGVGGLAARVFGENFLLLGFMRDEQSNQENIAKGSVPGQKTALPAGAMVVSLRRGPSWEGNGDIT